MPYEIKKYERTSAKLAPPELKKVHPLGKSPVVTFEQDGKTHTLAESGAIVEFLIARFGKGRMAPSSESDDWLSYLFWLHWAEGSAMTPLMLLLVFSALPKQSPFFLKPLMNGISGTVISKFINPSLANNFGFVEKELAGKDWFVGSEPTGADIMMFFPIEGFEAGGDMAKYPNITKFMERARARPAYKRAEEKGGVNDLKSFM